MLLLAASAYPIGTSIGLRRDIRMTIAATLVVLIFALGSRLMGYTGRGDTVFGAFVTIAALQLAMSPT